MHWRLLVVPVCVCLCVFVCLMYLCNLPFIVTKNDVFAAAEKTDPDRMKVIHMYYSSLPPPFILTVDWNCM